MAIPGPQIYRPFVWLPFQEHCLTNILALDRRVGEHGKLVCSICPKHLFKGDWLGKFHYFCGREAVGAMQEIDLKL